MPAQGFEGPDCDGLLLEESLCRHFVPKIDEPDENVALRPNEDADAPQEPGFVTDDFDERLLGGAFRIEVGEEGGGVREIEFLVFAGEPGGECVESVFQGVLAGAGFACAGTRTG